MDEYEVLQHIMTTSEAAQRWGYKENTIRAAIARGRFDEQIRKGMLRKSGDTWLIHEKAMYEVYGKPKK
ncbi:DNA-binding protein [Thermoactinomyces daqus]|uniref:DNA-binding protein n=1 Tax=Thermoactinomyces daqus TaxID=1329516 RepID=A0A7W1XDB7_9BACL|nr:helix-turn-helix domain-containing protein [Thermoactinomyces daqus]MBA4544594.1 DNA-binding protein [Thermoactinomyces daqus]